ncbi:MAG: sulfotransferase [Nocardioides sp.]
MDYFLVVGAQKAGTSWLHRQFRRHPQIHVPTWKEVHYFDIVCPPPGSASFAHWYTARARQAVAARRWRAADRLLEVLQLPFADHDGTAYRSFLGRDAPDGVRMIGEMTPAYAALDERGLRFADQVLDGPRILFIMRDPLARWWSSVRMRIADNPESVFASPIVGPAHWGRADYATTIRRLEAVFPLERIHYGFYEELFSEEALGAIASFLGVQQTWPWALDERVREGPQAPMPEPSAALLEQLTPVYQFVHDRFGDGVPNSWRH